MWLTAQRSALRTDSRKVKVEEWSGSMATSTTSTMAICSTSGLTMCVSRVPTCSNLQQLAHVRILFLAGH